MVFHQDHSGVLGVCRFCFQYHKWTDLLKRNILLLLSLIQIGKEFFFCARYGLCIQLIHLKPVIFCMLLCCYFYFLGDTHDFSTMSYEPLADKQTLDGDKTMSYIIEAVHQYFWQSILDINYHNFMCPFYQNLLKSCQKKKKWLNCIKRCI